MVDVDDHIEGEELGEDTKKEEDENKNLSEELKEKIRETFDIFDKEKNGQIETESLSAFLRAMGYNPTNDEVMAYCQKYDQRQDQLISLTSCMKICNEKAVEPDTIDEFVEAAKIFDSDNDGKIEVSELRWAMTQLGDKFDESTVDDMIAALDTEKSGFIEIEQFAKVAFDVKDPKPKDEKKATKKDGKK